MLNKNKAINGGKWITISTTVAILLQFLQVSVLARLLGPADFGVVSISTLVINFFNIFANLGFSNSIIYKQENDRKILSTLYYVNILFGIIIFFLINLGSPLLVAAFREERLTRVLGVSSFYFLIVYVGQIYSFLLQKELKFRHVAIIDIAGSVTGATVAIFCAYGGYAELSLIYGQLAMQLVRTVMQVAFGIHLFLPSPHFYPARIREHLRFGVYNVGDGLIGFLQGNSDNLLIGGLLGVKMLGFYTIAYQLAIFPISKLNPIILQVAYPVLAKIKDNTAELKKSYIKILDLVSYTNMPLLAGLFVVSDSVVPLLYGPGWETSIDLIKIFVFQAFFTCLGHPLFTIAFSKGKPNLLFYLNLTALCIKLPMIYLFARYWGIMGVAFAFMLTTFIHLILNFCIVNHLIGNFLKDFFHNVLKPVAFCLVMVTVVSFYKYFTVHSGLLNTIAQVAIGGIIYIGLTLVYKVSLDEIKHLRRVA